MEKENDKKPEENNGSKPSEQKPIEGYRFKVNGQELLSQHEKLVALDILRLAENKGVFSGKPEDYLLQGTKQDTPYKLDDWVDLSVEKEFVAIPNSPTPVAQAAGHNVG